MCRLDWTIKYLQHVFVLEVLFSTEDVEVYCTVLSEGIIIKYKNKHSEINMLEI